MNGYNKAGLAFTIIAGLVGAFFAWQYVEMWNIREAAANGEAVCIGHSNVFVPENARLQLCEVAGDQRQMQELKDMLTGLF